MHINDITSSLTRINQENNVADRGKFYTFNTYTELTKKIFFNVEYAKNNTPVMPLEAKNLSPGDEPLIEIITDVAKILNEGKYTKQKSPHATVAKKISDLQTLKASLSTHENFNLDEYCELLIDECIASLKNINKKEIAEKTSALNFGLNASSLTEAQHDQLIVQSQQLDKFFNSFGKFKKVSKDAKSSFEEFINVWTAGIYKLIENPSRDRDRRIKRLEKSATNLPEALAPDTNTFNNTKATLNFMLALAILAKELKSSEPNQDEIAMAQNLIKESAKFSKPAELISKMDFNDWKNFSLSPEDMEKAYEDMSQAIKDAGCEEFVSKRDLKEVFKRLSPEAVSKAKAIHILKTIAAILTLPIVWTALASVLALTIITSPLWAFFMMSGLD